MSLGANGSEIDAVIGLGSNLGDRRALLAGAVRSLREAARVLGVSALYETLPLGPEQPHFLNAAVRIATGETPECLLERLLGIERMAGRVRRERWGPRVLDLDLLWIRGLVVATPSLEVPHPELLGRAFALVPLLDVAPEATDPRTGRRYADIARELGRAGVERSADQLDL